jgi:predicted secreted protein
MFLRTLLFVVLLLSCQLAWSDAADHYNRITFQSDAAREVSNDLLIARMSVEINDKRPALIAQKINATLNTALKKAAAFGTVKTSTGDQNTEAVYGKKNQLIGYRGHAELRLESRDFDASSELISQLQATMQLAGIDFSIAPETRKQVEGALIAEAIDAYKKRAEAMRGFLNGSAYKLVRLDINHSSNNFQDEYGNTRLLFRNRESKPTLAGGKSEVHVQITSTIEITPQ